MDLLELLVSWEMPADVIKNFKENAITPDILRDIIEGDVLKELCPVIGTRIKLQKNIQEYLTSTTDTLTTTSEDILTEDIDIDNIDIKDIFVPSQKLPHFELKTLLTTSPCGKSILTHYELHNVLTNKLRNQLTDIIVRHIFTYIVNNHITNEDYNVIAAKIITLFPTDNIGIYYVPAIKKRDSINGKPVFAKGKLVDKVRNILYKSGERKRKNTEEKENDNPVKNQKLLQNLKDINEDKLAWLKNNIDPWEQVLEYWTATYEVRCATHYNTVADFLNEWNILNDVRGEALINIDYDKKYPNSNTHFFIKWNDFFNKVANIKAVSCKDECIIKELEEIKHEDEDKKAIKQVMLLCQLIPPKGRLNRRVKFSTVECIEGIVVNVQNPGDIQQTIDKITKLAKVNKTTVQPYIVACETETAAAYYLVIDTIKYNFTSATKALDTLFKCYHTLNASYPKASDHIYLVIQRCVYGIKTKYDNVVPYITDVLALN